jgi:hypothetical protein
MASLVRLFVGAGRFVSDPGSLRQFRVRGSGYETSSSGRSPANASSGRLKNLFAAVGGTPKVLRVDNGPEMVSQALQRFCEHKTGMFWIAPDNREARATSNHSTTGFGRSASTRQHRHSALGYVMHGPVRCGVQVRPHRCVSGIN